MRDCNSKMTQIVADYCVKCHPKACNEAKCGGKQGMTVYQLGLWFDSHENEQCYKDFSQLKKTYKQQFTEGKLPQKSYQDQLPEGLDAFKYKLMFEKIWQILRHDLYMAVEKEKKALAV